MGAWNTEGRQQDQQNIDGRHQVSDDLAHKRSHSDSKYEEKSQIYKYVSNDNTNEKDRGDHINDNELYQMAPNLSLLLTV